MLDEQIVNILLKYKDENFQEIANINNSINSIKGELENVQANLSLQAYKELADLNKKDNNMFLQKSQDALYLKEYYQKFDTFLIPIDTEEEDDNKSDNNETVQSSKEPDESLELYLTSDEVCPCCHASMNNVKDYYYNYSEKDYKQISIFKCDVCDKKYVTFEELESIQNNIDRTNISLYMNYHHLLDIHSKITLQVKGTTSSCINKKHTTSDITVQIPVIYESGDIGFEISHAIYCHQCDAYIILKNDFDKINGVILCKVIDETFESKPVSNKFGFDEKQSELYQHGYNVQKKNPLSDKQRHFILLSLLNTGIMNLNQICTHLDKLVQIHKKDNNFALAIKKWKRDRDFITSNSKNFSSYTVDKIVLKFSCKKSLAPY